MHCSVTNASENQCAQSHHTFENLHLQERIAQRRSLLVLLNGSAQVCQLVFPASISSVEAFATEADVDILEIDGQKYAHTAFAMCALGASPTKQRCT